MPSKAVSNLIEVLTPIWERLLQRSSVDIGDNFFELGGDPWIAIELFKEIARVRNSDLSPLMIYAAPTVGELSAVLESSEPLRFPPLVLLKAATAGTPVFFIHGLGGNIMQFFQLLKCIETPHPIYGLQARGIDGLEEPCSSIEETVQFHVEAIKALQPHGPYVLVGYSLGGLVALEIALHLAETGEQIPLLVMIDSYPSLRYAPLAQRLRVYSRRFIHHTSLLARSPVRKSMRYAIGRLRHTSDTRGFAEDMGIGDSLGVDFTPAMRRVRGAATQALRQYRPRPYHGRVRFVKAATPLDFPDDPEKVWAKFTDHFELESVPGNHRELLTTNYESLARVISRYLRELSAGRLAGSQS